MILTAINNWIVTFLTNVERRRAEAIPAGPQSEIDEETNMLPILKNDPDIYVQIRDMARKFANDVVRPKAEQLDREERFPREIYEQMGELGLLGITVPAELGGAGLDSYAYSIVMEELSRGYASVADQCGVVELIGTLLTRFGTDSQRSALLKDVVSARKIVSYCISEAEAGSDVAAIKTTAVSNGDGWRLNGGKTWISQRAGGGRRLRVGAH